MKLLNIFKKEAKSTTKVTVHKMDKTQLSKVIGGGDGTVIDSTLKASDGKKHFEVTS